MSLTGPAQPRRSVCAPGTVAFLFYRRPSKGASMLRKLIVAVVIAAIVTCSAPATEIATHNPTGGVVHTHASGVGWGGAMEEQNFCIGFTIDAVFILDDGTLELVGEVRFLNIVNPSLSFLEIGDPVRIFADPLTGDVITQISFMGWDGNGLVKP